MNTHICYLSQKAFKLFMRNVFLILYHNKQTDRKLGIAERGLHCFCVMARVRKVMKAATAKAEKRAPTAMKNLRPLSQVRQ